MDLVLDLLQTIGVLSSIALIIILASRKVNFGVAILLGSLVIGITSGVTLDQAIKVLFSVFQDIATYELILDVALIGILGFVLKETQLIQDMIQALRKILPRKALIALIPAIFGIMPMPGGALVSAPLIDREATELGLSPDRKTFVNLWFRHIWFFVLTISSSLVLASRIANINIYSLVILQVPTFLFMTLLGSIYLIRTVKVRDSRDQGSISFTTVILGVAPILVAVVLNLIGLWLPIALSIGILSVFLIKRGCIRSAPKTVWKGLNRGLVLATFSVMVFRSVIGETQAFNEIFVSLQQVGVPSIFFFTVFPFLLGFVAAMPTSGIAIGFSLVLPLFQNVPLSMVSLMYQSIIIGYAISPMHLCLILTNEYYHSKIQMVYKTWGPMVLATYAFGLLGPTLMAGFV
ncbi:MAG: uncharacterized protein QG670_2400 [Thermoproteota archaeon]|nr:uncharacterized protein [Thermoproteota archaeon]